MAGRRSKIKTVLATTQGKTYTIAIVTFFMIVLMFFLAIRPAFISILDHNEENQEKREYLEQLIIKENNLKALAKQEVDNRDGIVALQEIFPGSRNDELIVANISAVVVDPGCVLQSVDFDDTSLVQDDDLAIHIGITAVEFNVSINCDIDGFLTVVEGLEDLPIPVRVQTIAIADSDESGGNNSEYPYNMSVSATYYYWSSF